jgi:hypothetical protein
VPEPCIDGDGKSAEYGAGGRSHWRRTAQSSARRNCSNGCGTSTPIHSAGRSPSRSGVCAPSWARPMSLRRWSALAIAFDERRTQATPAPVASWHPGAAQPHLRLAVPCERRRAARRQLRARLTQPVLGLQRSDTESCAEPRSAAAVQGAVGSHELGASAPAKRVAITNECKKAFAAGAEAATTAQRDHTMHELEVWSVTGLVLLTVASAALGWLVAGRGAPSGARHHWSGASGVGPASRRAHQFARAQ